MERFIDLTGQKFDRLTVIKKVDGDRHGHTKWLCKCDCGKIVIARSYDLRKERAKSCGCFKTEQLLDKVTKHGGTNKRIYCIWTHIKTRCYNKNDTEYHNYGGRGIKVCDEWKNDFQAFYEWAMRNGYADNLTIDRIDVNGNYEPSNCRWATRKVQNNNKRNSCLIEYNGKTQSLTQWADEYGISRTTLHNRIYLLNWDKGKAITTPPKHKEQ